ncbi:MAG: hypothetical protein AVDCRST_MAG78-1979, partial [uncultured Rubrobacteraceae bacterium]
GGPEERVPRIDRRRGSDAGPRASRGLGRQRYPGRGLPACPGGVRAVL